MAELSAEIYALADEFRQELLRNERAAAARMVRIYGDIWRRLDREIKNLAAQYYTAQAAGEQVSVSWLYEFQRLQLLRNQVEREISNFAQYAEREMRVQQWRAVQEAGSHVERMIIPQLPPGADIAFHRIPREALTNLVGFLADGSPLSALLKELAPGASQAVADALIQGLALGLHPRQIALSARKALGGNLARALTIARTETLRAYREATRRTYQANNDLIGSWIWRSARNERTCAACWALDGTEHGLDERLDDHPRGRCFSVPKVKSWRGLGFEEIDEARKSKPAGVEAFERLPESDKIKILGPAKYAAYRDGKIKLPDLVGRRYDPRWGSMRYERSLKELGIDIRSPWFGLPGPPTSMFGVEIGHLHELARAIDNELAPIVGGKSKWNGYIVISSRKRMPEAVGIKDWDCSIWLRDDATPGTLVHELLHGRSRGQSKSAYKKYFGLEEGVVEQLTKMYGSDILKRVSLKLDDREDIYKDQTDALESLRMSTGMKKEDFYLTLFRTELANRLDLLKSWGAERIGKTNWKILMKTLRTRKP